MAIEIMLCSSAGLVRVHNDLGTTPEHSTAVELEITGVDWIKIHNNELCKSVSVEQKYQLISMLHLCEPAIIL